MSQIQVDTIYDRDGTGAPNFPNGVTVTGVTTATSFAGSGDNLTFTSISASTGTYSGNVSVGGTLTYEDVTSVDSVGLVTARLGLDVTAGGIDVTAGGINVAAGICTFPANSTIGGGVPATTGKAIAMAMVFG